MHAKARCPITQSTTSYNNSYKISTSPKSRYVLVLSAHLKRGETNLNAVLSQTHGKIDLEMSYRANAEVAAPHSRAERKCYLGRMVVLFDETKDVCCHKRPLAELDP